ncbi:hypothetical protein GK011_21200, partial [Erwinia sp. J316]
MAVFKLSGQASAILMLHCYYGSGHLLQSEFLHGGERHTLAEYARDRLHRETERTLGALTER